MVLKKLISIGTLPFFLGGCIAPVIIGGTAVVGTAATESRGLDGVARDNRIRAEITYKWNVEKVDLSGIDVTVFNRRVLLVGYTKDEATKKKLIDTLNKVSGHTEVIEDIKVGASESFGDYTRDAWMTTKLKANLMTNSKTSFQNYTLRTFDSTIYIFGIAQCQEEYQEILKEAKSIKGVKNVRDFIDIDVNRKPVVRGEEYMPLKEGIEYKNPETPPKDEKYKG